MSLGLGKCCESKKHLIRFSCFGWTAVRNVSLAHRILHEKASPCAVVAGFDWPSIFPLQANKTNLGSFS
uniref:Putative ovule protein n=1 Tax=Solanum chacoense TaxID=4108 RepID=A0A0V0HDH4_SOLCH